MIDTDKYLAAVVRYYTSVDRAYFREGFPDLWLGELDSARILESGARSLLIGPPGSGKTTFLDWAALHAARSREVTPIFVSLRNYTSDLKDLLQISVERFAPDADLPLLEPQRAAGFKPTFLFDAVDEVPHSFRSKVENEILQMADLWPTAPIVVTSRMAPGSPLWADWSAVEIPQLTDQQIDNFLRSVPRGEELRNALFESSEFRELARRPTFLHTIRNAWMHGTDYRTYLMREIPRYVSWRGHTLSRLPANISPQIIDQLLSSIALDLAIRGTHSLSMDRLQQLAGQIAQDGISVGMLVDAGRATDVLRTEDDEVSFIHMSMLESYAARALAARIETPGALEPYFSSVLAGSFGKRIADYFLGLITDIQLSDLRTQLPQVDLETLFERNGEALADRASAPVGASQGDPRQFGNVASLVIRFSERQELARKDILVISVHGFNTRGDWKNRLGLILTKATDGERFIYRAWDYGDFGLGIFDPCARNRQVRKFQTFYNDLVGSFPKLPEIVVVAHSFGAYIVAHAARTFPEVEFNRVLLLGAALPQRFDWSRSIDRCGKVLNIIGGSDGALALARFVPGLGSAGKNGFLTTEEGLVQIREEFSDHGDLFGNEYMRRTWLPYLRDGDVTRGRRG